MIAAVTWRCRAALPAAAADLHRVAQVVGIELAKASWRVRSLPGSETPEHHEG